MHRIRLALDWTANANQSGIHAAIHHGWYQEAGIDLEIQPHDYNQSPAAKVESGVADLAICAMECLLSYHHSQKAPLQAVAAVLQNDLSSIAVLESSGIERPAQLDGTVHASYKACNKDSLIACLVRNDGGQSNVTFQYPGSMGIWEALVDKKADSTWIFENWQGVQAKCAGIAVRHFKVTDFGIPYSYSPVLVSSKSCIQDKSESLRAFLAATAKGYAWAASNPKGMAELLFELVPEEGKAMLEAAQAATSPHYLSPQTGSWGFMDLAKVDAYLQWLYEQGLESTRIDVHAIVTNDFLTDGTKSIAK